MRRIVRVLALLAAAGSALWIAGVRRQALTTHRAVSDVVKADARRFVTYRFDPVVMRLGLVGGLVSPWAVLEHVGRTTGITHRTPVYARLRDDFLFIPLAYGADAQWVRNIQAAGHCRIQRHQTIYDLDEPAIVTAAENVTLSGATHRAIDGTGATYLRLHVLRQAPGTLDAPFEPTTATSGDDIWKPEPALPGPAEAADRAMAVSA